MKRLFTRASVIALVASSVAIVGACSDDEDGGSSGTSSGGCGEPGAACTKNDECCQQCQCKGSTTTITLRSCAITTTKLCLPCDDFCGTKGVETSGKCAGC